MPTLAERMRELGITHESVGLAPPTVPPTEPPADVPAESALPRMPTVPLRTRPLPPERVDQEDAAAQTERVFRALANAESWDPVHVFENDDVWQSDRWETAELAFGHATPHKPRSTTLDELIWRTDGYVSGFSLGRSIPKSRDIDEVPFPGTGVVEEAENVIRVVRLKQRVMEALTNNGYRPWTPTELVELTELEREDIMVALLHLHSEGLVAHQRHAYDEDTYLMRRVPVAPEPEDHEWR